MNILIIGGAGFLGLNLANVLHKNHKVYLLDKSIQSMLPHSIMAEMSGLYETSISDVDGIVDIINDQQIDCVINLVSSLLPASLFEAFENEIRDVFSPACHLVNELERKNIKYVYVSSGGAVYGSSTSDIVSENSCQKPINLYGLSKCIFEQYILYSSRTSGLDYLILRPSNPYGSFQNPGKKQGLIAVAVDAMLRGEEIEIWGDGSTIRDYVWIEDLANAVSQLLERGVWNETFNIGSGVGYSVIEVLKTIEEVSGISLRCRFKDRRSVDVSRILLDVSKLKSAIDFEPIELRMGIGKYMEGLRLARS
jgi:UDP-glucose 4-epimerase